MSDTILYTCRYYSVSGVSTVTVLCLHKLSLLASTITETCEDDTVTVASTTYYNMNDKTEDNRGGIYRQSILRKILLVLPIYLQVLIWKTAPLISLVLLLVLSVCALPSSSLLEALL